LLLWLQYHRDLWLIGKERKRIRRRYALIYRKAILDGRASDELFAITAEQFEEMALLGDKQSETVSIYLVQRANAVHIPTPDHFDQCAWEISHRTGMHRLNKDAVAKLASAIRKEKQERLHLWERRARVFASAATALTGFMGALIGVMTLITFHRS
jgi:hypothetical protein